MAYNTYDPANHTMSLSIERVYTTKKYPIHFNNIEEVTDFVRIVNQFDCDVDIRKGSVVIDAKSFLGVMTISGSSDLELVIHDNEPADLISSVSEYIATKTA